MWKVQLLVNSSGSGGSSLRNSLFGAGCLYLSKDESLSLGEYGCNSKSNPGATCMNAISGSHSSYWIDSTPDALFPPLASDITVDVAIVGGGIAGLTAGALLKQAGKTVAVLEAKQIGMGTSGHTTAKITSLHQLIYAELIDAIGEEKAKLYADSNQAAIAQVAQFVQEHDIDCDFSRLSAFTFADTEKNLDQIQAEVEAATRLGLPASFTTESTLPFDIAGAVRFDNQAQFHVRKYLVHLAKLISGNGSFVLEQTRVQEVEDGSPCRVMTEHGVVTAQDVLVTTNLPILDQGLYFAKTFPKRSYIIGAVIDPARSPQGIFIGVGDDYHSIRTTPHPEGTLLLIGGGGHKVGAISDTEDRYAGLVDYGRSHFGIETVQYYWSSQDVVSFDRIPYIGKLTPLSQHVYVATGFSLWGMSNGTLSGMLLADLVQGIENPWASLYDSTRATPFFTSKSLKNNLETAAHWVGDRLKGLTDSLQDVGKGEGKLVTVNGHKVAAYRDATGELHAVSATCTHLGCIVNWNSAEKSWDCPCHGGRFSCTGEVLHGPPTAPLKPLEK